MNLFAGSYGTRAAQVYLRTHPQSVRTVYLGSPVPIDVATPLAMAKTAETALERLFDECAADTACETAFPKLREEFGQIFIRLASGEVRVSIPHRADTVQLSRGRVAEWIRAKLYRPKTASILPWVIHRAYAGDWSPIVDDILSSDSSDFSFGLLFAITCSEDMPFIREPDVLAESTASLRLPNTGALFSADLTRYRRRGRWYAAVVQRTCRCRILKCCRGRDPWPGPHGME
jgi:pimeloyl-ACP methyl ester carboxylesterase